MSDQLPKKSLTIKERKFVKALAATGSKVEAAHAAYNTKYPQVMAQKALARPHVREAFEAELEKLNLNVEAGVAAGVGRMLAALQDPNTSLREVQSLVESLSRLKGLNAPTQHESKQLRATVSLPKK